LTGLAVSGLGFDLGPVKATRDAVFEVKNAKDQVVTMHLDMKANEMGFRSEYPAPQ
jgi:hypothetical protein